MDAAVFSRVAQAEAKVLAGFVGLSKSIIEGVAFGGDGVDGNVTISVNSSIPYADKVMRYNTLTINQGVTLSPHASDKGMIICVKGKLTVNGLISASGKGATGGAQQTGNNFTGNNGTDGGYIAGSGGRGGGAYESAYGLRNGGNGGNTIASGATTYVSGYNGATGLIGQYSPTVLGGTSLANIIRQTFGAGGGAGAGKVCESGNVTGGAGGIGGGYIYIEADEIEISVTGAIRADGTNGGNGTVNSCPIDSGGQYRCAAGGGAGGAGGLIILRAKKIIKSGVVSAAGGTGGNGAQAAQGQGGNGGIGGAGLIWEVLV